MSKKIIFGLIILIVFLACSTLAISFERKKGDDLYRNLELFSDTLAIVDMDYVDEVKPKDLIYGSLKGMLSSLDPHSQFMDPDTYNELKSDTEGKFGGLGIEISIKDDMLTIITPIEDTPAWRAGLKAGDRIVKINNELTRGIGISEAMKKLRGKPNEAVNLTILRESEKKVLEFKVTRAIIKINDIKEVKILEGGIGYIRLIEFRDNTPKDFIAAIEKLTKLKMGSLILDIRNNPGGVLESALEITGEFVPEGKLLAYTKGRKEGQNLKFHSRAKHPMLDLPMVVLINEGSASGSEILAGVLQDYKRALVLGAKSFGKGSVQTVIPLSDGSALRLTTSKYFTPSGKVIHGKGVIPDIAVELKPKGEEDKEILEYAGLLKDKRLKIDKPWDYKSDLQVMAAVNLLKVKTLNKAQAGK